MNAKCSARNHKKFGKSYNSQKLKFTVTGKQPGNIRRTSTRQGALELCQLIINSISKAALFRDNV